MNPISESGLEVAGSDGMQTYDKQLNQSILAQRRKRYLVCGLGTLPFVCWLDLWRSSLEVLSEVA